ncbi:hypothetical protein H1R20_g6641, partial [Candolleomyces eurysporus]
MTLAVYTKTEIDSHYLITYVRLYFILAPDAKIRLGSFIVRNLVGDVINATQGAIDRPPSTPELAAALALLDQKYAERGPDLLQQLWTLASPTEDPPPLIHSVTSSVAHLPHNQAPPDYRPSKRRRATSDPDFPGPINSGHTNPNEPSSSHSQ